MANAPGLDLSTIYMIVGTLVVMNLGGLGTGLFLLIKGVWQAAILYKTIGDMKEDINAAHKKIRDLEKK